MKCEKTYRTKRLDKIRRWLRGGVYGPAGEEDIAYLLMRLDIAEDRASIYAKRWHALRERLGAVRASEGLATNHAALRALDEMDRVESEDLL